MSSATAGRGVARATSPGWFCDVGGWLYAWSSGQWELAAAPAASTIDATPANPEAPATLWYWDGQRWIAPGEPGDPVADGRRPPKFALGLVVAAVIAVGLTLMTWAIGDRLDWATCPGQNCNAGVTVWDSIGGTVMFGLVVGAAVTVVEWLSRRSAGRSRPQPPGPWDANAEG